MTTFSLSTPCTNEYLSWFHLRAIDETYLKTNMWCKSLCGIMMPACGIKWSVCSKFCEEYPSCFLRHESWNWASKQLCDTLIPLPHHQQLLSLCLLDNNHFDWVIWYLIIVPKLMVLLPRLLKYWVLCPSQLVLTEFRMLKKLWSSETSPCWLFSHSLSINLCFWFTQNLCRTFASVFVSSMACYFLFCDILVTCSY